MKAILKFDLDDVDDADRHKLMLNAMAMQGVIYEITALLREWDKYGIPGPLEALSAQEIVETLRQRIKDSLLDHDVRDF